MVDIWATSLARDGPRYGGCAITQAEWSRSFFAKMSMLLRNGRFEPILDGPLGGLFFNSIETYLRWILPHKYWYAGCSARLLRGDMQGEKRLFVMVCTCFGEDEVHWREPDGLDDGNAED